MCVFACALRLYPATPGWGVRCGCVGFRLRSATQRWGVGACVCLCGRSACTPPLLAGVCGAAVCAWARVSAAPRHSWLGCWGLCVFVCAPRLYPATPGLGVRCGCVCLGSGFGCPPPLLAGVLGCVCAYVRAPLVPRHSWLGCAVWVCVLGLGFRLRPATPGRFVGVCVCLCARSACSPPLLAGVCSVGVCAWARVSAVPRHSWPGCWGVCVPVCALRLYPATPGWCVRCGCVCLGSGFGCAPPLLAGVLGCVCAFVRAQFVPRHSRLCRAVWVCVLGLGFRLRPTTRGWGVGVCVCFCALSACTMPLVARLCGVAACAGARVWAAPRHSWLGCWGVCVLVCALRLYPASPGWGVRLGCLCLGSGFGCAPQLLAGVLGCVCVLGARSPCAPPLPAGVCGVGVCVMARVVAAPRLCWLGFWGVRVCERAALVPRQSWLGCAVWVCVLGLGFRLRPATPGWGVGVCVCVCVRAPLVPRPSWLGYAAWVRVLGLGFRLRLATPGWGVGVCVCVCVLAPLTPRHSWLGCSVSVGVPGLWFLLRPASRGWGVGVRVCLCACSACTPPPPAGVCVLGLGTRLRRASPGWGVGVCVCLCALSACTPPLLAGVCVLGLGFRLRPATSG